MSASFIPPGPLTYLLGNLHEPERWIAATLDRAAEDILGPLLRCAYCGRRIKPSLAGRAKVYCYGGACEQADRRRRRAVSRTA